MLGDTKNRATHHRQSAHYSSTPILTQGGINPDIWSPGGNCEKINREENTGDFGKVRNICELWHRIVGRMELWVAPNYGSELWVAPNAGMHRMLVEA